MPGATVDVVSFNPHNSWRKVLGFPFTDEETGSESNMTCLSSAQLETGGARTPTLGDLGFALRSLPVPFSEQPSPLFLLTSWLNLTHPA